MAKTNWKLEPGEKMVVYAGNEASSKTYQIKVRKCQNTLDLTAGGEGEKDKKWDLKEGNSQDLGPGFRLIALKNPSTTRSAAGYYTVID